MLFNSGLGIIAICPNDQSLFVYLMVTSPKLDQTCDCSFLQVYFASVFSQTPRGDFSDESPHPNSENNQQPTNNHQPPPKAINKNVQTIQQTNKKKRQFFPFHKVCFPPKKLSQNLLQKILDGRTLAKVCPSCPESVKVRRFFFTASASGGPGFVEGKRVGEFSQAVFGGCLW